MIVAAHLATGAFAGALLRRRSRALLAGPVLHLAGDVVPHRDMPRALEILAGSVTAIAIARRAGASSPALVGALAAAAPDVEHLHVVERSRPLKLFPSHRIPGLHREGGLSPAVQLAGAAALVWLLPRVSGRGGQR